METTFFRFANKEGEDPKLVYSSILRMVGFTSLVFIGLVFAFIGPISSAMGYPEHPSYIWSLAIVVALDAFQAILFSYLRYQKRPLKFAALKLLFIGLNIALNLVYFVLLPKLYDGNPGVWGKLYDPGVGVGYVFYINLFCTSLVTFFFAKELKGIGYGFDWNLCKRMLSYSWPILVLGIAGILNQTADKILFPKVYPGADANVQLGIYGAVVKIAMIMALITQAFRYAYEPFVFGNSREKDNKETYAKGMKYFVIFTLLAFLCVMAYMNVLRYIIKSDRHRLRRPHRHQRPPGPEIRLHGLRLGRFRRLRRGDAAVLFRGAEVLSHRLSHQGHARLYAAGGRTFRRHHLLQQASRLLAGHPREHGPGRRLPRLHREEGPAAGGNPRDREILQEIKTDNLFL